MRLDNRQSDELRPIQITRGFTQAPAGSVLVQAGRTMVLCTASVESQVPAWMEGKGTGWVTAEYSMLPASTVPRKRRERDGKIDGRSNEIQRLIGRSLRAVTDLAMLGERTIAIDCDVLQADGGTRTLSITGAFVALVDAIAAIRAELPGSPLRDSVAATSVGILEGQLLLDLNQREDSSASVDMNVVMTGRGQLVEVQGTGEEATFSEDELTRMLALARRGIGQLTALQRAALGSLWPFAE
ncbi:MAG: ribonuclease PH [Thermoguttaceae bacterium]|jgi:ribonuclease PH